MDERQAAAPPSQPVQPKSRRPIKTRSHGWSRRLAFGLARAGVAPNAISLGGLIPAGMSAACLALSPHVGTTPRVVLLVVAAAGIQLRLLANMLDGLVAVEAGRHTRTGDLFNEVPDRIADIAILVGAGAAVTVVSWGPTLGLTAALVAVVTAYIRLLGGSLGQVQDYSGPMAKSHRMALMTVACVASAVTGPLVHHADAILAVALGIVALGSVATAIRRLAHIAGRMPA